MNWEAIGAVGGIVDPKFAEPINHLLEGAAPGVTNRKMADWVYD